MNIVLSVSRPGFYTLEKYDGRDIRSGISREMKSEASKLFSRDYGAWGSLASEKMKGEGGGKKKGGRMFGDVVSCVVVVMHLHDLNCLGRIAFS